MLSVKNLDLYYGDAQALSDVSLEVPKGEQSSASAPLAAIAVAHATVECRLAAEAPFWRETRQFHQHAAKFEAATLDWLRTRTP